MEFPSSNGNDALIYYGICRFDSEYNPVVDRYDSEVMLIENLFVYSDGRVYVEEHRPVQGRHQKTEYRWTEENSRRLANDLHHMIVKYLPSWRKVDSNMGVEYQNEEHVLMTNHLDRFQRIEWITHRNSFPPDFQTLENQLDRLYCKVVTEAHERNEWSM